MINNKSSSRIADNSLLFSILPKSGFYCVCEKPITTDKIGPMIHHWFDSKRGALEFVESFKNETAQIFVAQASFKQNGTEKSGRKQKNAAFLRVLFLDIDCGKGKDYASQAEARKALMAFCEITDFPLPTLVNSGNGYYAYWVLKAGIDADTWKSAALKLKKLVKAIAPGLDQDGIIADSARILRPEGSYNRKDQSNPKKVTLVERQESISFRSFAESIDNALANLPPEPASCEQTTDSTIQHNSNKSSSAYRIAEKCAVISMLKTVKGDVSEPLWYGCIGLLRHCKEAPEIIHTWSKGHASYNRKETDTKILHHKKPPTTCAFFAGLCPDLCNVCEHNGKIKCPIVLGFTESANIPDYIEELNNIHFVSRFGSKTVVCREFFDMALKRNKLEMSLFTDFRNFYCNLKVKIGLNKDDCPVTVQLGKAWLEHPQRRSYNDIQLTPEGDIEGVYNLWRRFQVVPKEGSWKLIKEHILHVICCGNKKHYWYVINWLAHLIQRPWLPAEVALVLRGKKGIGKGFFVKPFSLIFGQHFMSIYNGKHLTGNFNAHLEDCILLHVDEAFWAGDKSGESVLKGLITEPTIPIERKGIDVKPVRNLLHIIMASNNDWVVPASMDERRYCVLNVSDCHCEDRPYFTALDYEINNGGMEAMLFYLQNKDISKFDIRTVPKTDGLKEQKIQSLGPVVDWWYQKLVVGELLPSYGWDTVSFPDLYNDYVERAQKQGIHRRVSDTAFGKQLHDELLPDGWPKKKKGSSKNSTSGRVKLYRFPSLEECRKHFEKLLGVDSLDWRK